MYNYEIIKLKRQKEKDDEFPGDCIKISKCKGANIRLKFLQTKQNTYIYLCTSVKIVFQEASVLDVYTREIKCVSTPTSTNDVHAALFIIALH